MNTKSYALVTASYWGFTLTDGALRMLVLLYFHGLGYSPVALAFLFLLYEFCGVLTNLLGGWIGSRVGLRLTLFVGLGLQVAALVMLSLLDEGWSQAFAVGFVMVSQALSGIAKDLTKMSSKSAVKVLVKEGGEGEGSALFKWVAILTGSKNALKGIGFFLGGVLMTWLGFQGALWLMAGCLGGVLGLALIFLREDMGRTKVKVKFTELFSKSREINWLSAARVFLFASRDVWFVVALPVFLKGQLGWSFSEVGGFMALWVIGYGLVQALAPRFVNELALAKSAFRWVGLLVLVTAVLGGLLYLGVAPVVTIVVGLGVFGFVFAVNSSLHSYLILAFTSEDQVAVNVGFYYMANAGGRLLGTLLSGVVYLWGGLEMTIGCSALLLLIAAACTFPLGRRSGFS